MGRDSNPQCPRGRTAFKAADFASLSTRARDVRIVRGRSRTRRGMPSMGGWGVCLLPTSASRTEPSAGPAPRGPLARVDLRVRGRCSPRWWAVLQTPRPDDFVTMLAISGLAQALGVLLVRGVADEAPVPC